MLSSGAASGAAPVKGDHGLQRSSSICICECVCCSCSLFDADWGPGSRIFNLFLGVFTVICISKSTPELMHNTAMPCHMRRQYEL